MEARNVTTLFGDLETYSDVPLTSGTHAYSARAEVMLFAYALDDGPVAVWDVTTGAPMPKDLAKALYDPDVLLCFHNSHFDRTVLRHALKIAPAIERWRDTMVQALAHGLPGGLAQLCDILQVPVDKAKDKAGRQLIQLFCKPRPKNSKIKRATRDTHSEEWRRFVEYASLDIEAMRVIAGKLPHWNYQGGELALWHFDQAINDRGFCVDVELALSAIGAVERAQAALAERTQELTDDAVQAATQRDALLRHLVEAYGVALPDMQRSTLERRIDDPDLPEPLRELLAIRLQASTTSTAKYGKLVNAVSTDNRLRGTLQFCGAGRTARWAGRLFQPHNLPRPSLKQKQIDAGIAALKANCADLVFDNVMELTSSALRGCIVAPKGKKLVVADLSNIEGRDQAWIAGEHWKLKAFADFDTVIGTDTAGKSIRRGHDLYKLAYSKSFGIRPDDVTSDQRQVGKVQELALGYEGGVGAFVTFAANYGLDLEQMAVDALDSIPDDIYDEATGALAWTKKTKRPMFGLSDRAWTVCESFKRSWRYAHPNISLCWKSLQGAAIDAVQWPGQTYSVGLLKLRRDGAWLRIRLPSGRCLCYPAPNVTDGQLSYTGINQYSRKWQRLNTYGGKLFENVCQAVARDVLAYNMLAIEQAGYQIVLTVHDEVVTEAPDSDEFNAEHLSALLAASPPWANGMPLAAAGFESYRYRKE